MTEIKQPTSILNYKNDAVDVKNWSDEEPKLCASWSRFVQLGFLTDTCQLLVHLHWILKAAAEPRLIMYWEKCRGVGRRSTVIVSMPASSRQEDVQTIQDALVRHVLDRIEHEKKWLHGAFQRQHANALASPNDLEHATVSHQTCPQCVQRNEDYVCESSFWCSCALLPSSLNAARLLRVFLLELPRPVPSSGSLASTDKTKCCIL